ncbi:MAG: hypothetical protein Q4E17_04450 [Synergistes sp.]|nr:hypothetical protein [Synergistes sp.]
MKIATITSSGTECAAIETMRGYIRLDVLNEEKRTEWPLTVEKLISSGEGKNLARWYNAGGEKILANITRRMLVERDSAQITGESAEF